VALHVHGIVIPYLKEFVCLAEAGEAVIAQFLWLQEQVTELQAELDIVVNRQQHGALHHTAEACDVRLVVDRIDVHAYFNITVLLKLLHRQVVEQPAVIEQLSEMLYRLI